MSVDLAVKMRDGHQMLADAWNEYLETLAPAVVKYDEQDFDKLAWTQKEGSKGPYMQTTKEANNNNKIFQGLQQILKEHNGFFQTSSSKYWTHRDNPDIIDRRPK